MAINAKIDLKKPVLEEISAQVEGAQCVLLVNYSGLTVAQDTQLRKELREAGVHYKVYKNTMMKRAFAGTAFESLTKDLDGTNAIAISKDDATAPARIIAKFAKTAPKLEMVSGVVEGNYYDKAWKHPVPDRKPGSRPQPDRRVQRRRSRGLSLKRAA